MRHYGLNFGPFIMRSEIEDYMRINLLKAGGSKNYHELLKPFKLNPKKPDFWQSGLDLISELIEEID